MEREKNDGSSSSNFFFKNPVRESLVLFLVWHFDTFATLNFDPKTWSRGSQEGGMEKIGRELSGRELSTWVVSTRKPWSDNVRMCCLIRTQWTISQYHYTSWWISLSSGVHVPPADCQRKINQVELLWKPSPRPLKPNVTGSCAKPLNLKTGISTESSNVFRCNSSKCVNNDVFVSLFGLWLLASELQNGQCPGAWQSLLPLPRSSHTSHETSNFKWKRHAAEKNGRKSASEKIGCIQLQGLRNVRGSKRFGFFLCLGYGAMASLGQETGWRERNHKP